MKLPRLALEQRTAACPRCRHQASFVCIRFPTGHRWIVDADCGVCGYDIGKTVVAHYPSFQPIDGERPLMVVDTSDFCPRGICLSDLFVVTRGNEMIAAACSNPECGYYVLPPGVDVAYADYLQLILYGIEPFGDLPDFVSRKMDEVNYESVEINIDDSRFPPST